MVAQLHYIEDNIEYITQLRHTVDTKTKNNLAVHKGPRLEGDLWWELSVLIAVGKKLFLKRDVLVDMDLYRPPEGRR